MKTLLVIETWLVNILETLVKVCIVLMTLGVFSQVILRTVFKMTFLPIEDILPYSFSITTFTGSALLFREKGHIAITFLADALPGIGGKIVGFIAETLTLFFLGFVLVVGTEFMIAGKYQFSPLLKIPLFYIFTVVPLFAFASLVFLLNRYLPDLKRR